MDFQDRDGALYTCKQPPSQAGTYIYIYCYIFITQRSDLSQPRESLNLFCVVNTPRQYSRRNFQISSKLPVLFSSCLRSRCVVPAYREIAPLMCARDFHAHTLTFGNLQNRLKFPTRLKRTAPEVARKRRRTAEQVSFVLCKLRVKPFFTSFLRKIWRKIDLYTVLL